MESNKIEVNILTLCDYAQEYNGRLMITGAFNSLVLSRFPFTYPEIALVARFSVPSSGEHIIEFGIKEVSGKYTLMEKQSIKMISTGELRSPYANLIIKGNNVIIPEPGKYQVLFKVDGQDFITYLTVSDVKNSKLVKSEIQIKK
ncbi:MAG: hypothetical protein IK041_01250 [Bacteroidales bacterium]|nr:hypothetical protein [Bacteroidales bacterium]